VKDAPSACAKGAIDPAVGVESHGDHLVSNLLSRSFDKGLTDHDDSSVARHTDFGQRVNAHVPESAASFLGDRPSSRLSDENVASQPERLVNSAIVAQAVHGNRADVVSHDKDLAIGCDSQASDAFFFFPSPRNNGHPAAVAETQVWRSDAVESGKRWVSWTGRAGVTSAAWPVNVAPDQDVTVGCNRNRCASASACAKRNGRGSAVAKIFVQLPIREQPGNCGPPVLGRDDQDPSAPVKRHRVGEFTFGANGPNGPREKSCRSEARVGRSVGLKRCNPTCPIGAVAVIGDKDSGP
jgi:hypothetical protein